MPAEIINTAGGKALGKQLRPRSSKNRNTGQVDSIWRGSKFVESFEFIAVGGGGRGGTGNWTNNIYGGGGGGGGLAAGVVASPVSGTVTVPAWGNQANCFGNTANAGQNGDGGNQPQYMYTAQGGTRSTVDGGNGGNGGKVNQVGVAGPTSAITGVTTNYGGGGGGAPSGAGGVLAGGAGGGGNGGDPAGTAGAVNSGGGGGGCRFSNALIAGGSGQVIIRYPEDLPELSSIGAGLTYTVTISGGFRRYTFTAGTGTVVV
jgi:hypothetical protein